VKRPARRRSPAPASARGRDLFADDDATLLDLVDNVLTKGVLIDGEIILGLADVDLVYLRLSAVLCSADRVLHPGAV
jgi:hypothetical protein